ncbi:aminopeptidase [Gemmatimonadetes bacterium T265]|nr:aminopeptidase [Gemmatimonadetes bacterium T265]
MLHLSRLGRAAALLAAFPAALAAQHPGHGRYEAPRPDHARGGGVDTSAAAVAARVQADVAFLAAPRLEGRFTGSPGADTAAAYVARRFGALGLKPVVVDAEDASRCATRVSLAPAVHGPAAGGDSVPCAGYYQRFEARAAALAHAGKPFALAAENVVGLVEGTDPALRGELVVVGAHYDHLGRETMFATDPQAGAVVHPGADDNASGVAAVLELARRVAARPLRRSVLFVAFSGEELGVLGSRYFVEHSPLPLDSAAAMLNFDMVGRLANDRLLVYGVATADELPAIVDSANAAGPRLAVKALGDGFGPSDHASFYAAGVPVLHFFTDQHPDYHAATDVAAKINAPGEARVIALAEGVLRRVGDRPARLTFRRAPGAGQTAAAPGGDPAAGPRPYFGSIPDMAADEVKGLRLQGVTPGSPADRGGLRAGDVVVEFGGRPVTDLYTYTDALYGHAPGDVVAVVVVRGGERVRASVTLGKRGE